MRRESKMNIDRDEIVRLTEEYCGTWGLAHVQRLLELIAVISEGQSYNADAMWVATYLHDWGAYEPWQREGVFHGERSREVAAEFLAQRGYPEDFIDLVLECIVLHHDHTTPKRYEAILLSDADALDFLGTVGILRDFSKNPRDMRKAYEASLQRRNTIPGQLVLERSRAIAQVRLPEMDALYANLQATSFGYF
jgi:uncharacterized protein